MSGCVTVTGPPAAICFLNSGMTLPLEPSTLPKRTAAKTVDVVLWERYWITISPIRLLAPMTLVGLTALSVEMKMKRETPCFSAAWAV